MFSRRHVIPLFLGLCLTSGAAVAGPSQVEKAWKRANDIEAPTVHRTYSHPGNQSTATRFNDRVNPRDYRVRQAEHAWNNLEGNKRARNLQFASRNIHNTDDLMRYAATVRRNYDDMKVLSARHGSHPRFVYMKFDEGSTKKGVIVVDDPGNPVTGGTIVTASDVATRFKNWK